MENWREGKGAIAVLGFTQVEQMAWQKVEGKEKGQEEFYPAFLLAKPSNPKSPMTNDPKIYDPEQTLVNCSSNRGHRQLLPEWLPLPPSPDSSATSDRMQNPDDL